MFPEKKLLATTNKMQDQTLILRNTLLGLEFLSALIAVFYFSKLKHTYWKWFCIYLVFIFIQEYYWFFNDTLLYNISKQQYYAYLGIPIQYLFFYWLYALKSLKNKNLYILFSVIYIASLILDDYLVELNIVYSLNMVVGATLLMILVILEYIKQIKTDDILRFKENKMFYINLGVILFYVGTLPFFAFYDVFFETPYLSIGDWYYLYFRISVCIMYLLFIFSFIWGRQPLK